MRELGREKYLFKEFNFGEMLERESISVQRVTLLACSKTQ